MAAMVGSAGSRYALAVDMRGAMARLRALVETMEVVNGKDSISTKDNQAAWLKTQAVAR